MTSEQIRARRNRSPSKANCSPLEAPRMGSPTPEKQGHGRMRPGPAQPADKCGRPVVRDNQPFCVQRHIGILRLSNFIDVGFLARAMESRLVFEQATACATGIAQKTVPLSGLRRLLIPIPPLAEQHRIVTRADELIALCDRLEASLSTGDDTRRRLLDALLHEVLVMGADRKSVA